MPKLIFDIETVGVDFETLDPTSQEYLLKFAQTDEEQTEAKEKLGFSPVTGFIVAIGILNPDTEKGAVYYQNNGSTPSGSITEGNMQYLPYSTEKDLLKAFWEVAQYYDQFITFNGRTFDNPFLMIRSAANKVKPTKNLMPNRYYDEHIDLFDRLSFFGAVRRMMSLHMWCQAFGIPSPKADGITGDDVGRLFKEGKHLEIARYCGGDLEATRQLYNYWVKYINIK